ncbi:restriction endonuclease subunit S [Psychroserpens sp. AS72]|uniref:restriction endonuclease subunit S n=1 Tax=Psychroserpens sp. AS72 TaxID=3135775 RepID=UPI00317FD820
MEVIEEQKKGYKKTEAGWIPDDWNIKKLKDVVDFLDSQRRPIKESDRSKAQGEYPYYGASGIIDYVSNYIFDEELILLGEDGANILNRSSRLAFKVKGKIWVNNHAHVLRVKPNVDIDFLNDYLESLDYRKYNTSITQPKLNKAVCKNIPVVYPSYLEQKKIGKILSEWDEAIEKTKSLFEKLQLRKNGLMQQLLTGKTRLASFNDEWQEDKLGNFFTERKDTGHDNLKLLSVGRNGVYPQDNTEKKDSSNSNKSKYKRICIGDIGYNTMRMWQGRSALSSLEGIVSPAYTILKPKEHTDSVFFSYLFKLEEMIHKFYRNSQGMVSDTWMCKFKDLAIIKFQAPSSKDEQTAIANILQEADAEIEHYQAYLKQLQVQKKGLMQKLLTGDIRVKV